MMDNTAEVWDDNKMKMMTRIMMEDQESAETVRERREREKSRRGRQKGRSGRHPD